MSRMRQRNERGAVATEFAILLPVLLLILFGTIEFGLIMFNREVITNASREGARAGIVQRVPKPTTGEITAVVTNYLTGSGINMGAVNVAVAGAGGANPATLTVTVNYTYTFIVPGVFGLGNTLPLTGQTVMRHE